ncbi:hypothetical protein SAMN05216387_107127 [Nitrosovibrio tenuis]|uniref:Uncharacterized protein n=1 Tax=Nitrosovibrio tenuis TaxID=1233 RepID=A0A1H7NT81_9PROT|nr:hypothetical protein SAMN05216387_107127 [Nitrosovibrio tenuis]
MKIVGKSVNEHSPWSRLNRGRVLSAAGLAAWFDCPVSDIIYANTK